MKTELGERKKIIKPRASQDNRATKSAGKKFLTTTLFYRKSDVCVVYCA